MLALGTVFFYCWPGWPWIRSIWRLMVLLTRSYLPLSSAATHILFLLLSSWLQGREYTAGYFQYGVLQVRPQTWFLQREIQWDCVTLDRSRSSNNQHSEMRCHETGSFEIHLICKVYKTSCWLCWETSSSSGLISLSSSSLLKLCCVGLELSGVVWSLRLSSNVSSSSAATAIDFNLRLASSLAKLFLIHLVSQFQPL